MAGLCFVAAVGLIMHQAFDRIKIQHFPFFGHDLGAKAGIGDIIGSGYNYRVRIESEPAGTAGDQSACCRQQEQPKGFVETRDIEV